MSTHARHLSTCTYNLQYFHCILHTMQLTIRDIVKLPNWVGSNTNYIIQGWTLHNTLQVFPKLPACLILITFIHPSSEMIHFWTTFRCYGTFIWLCKYLFLGWPLTILLLICNDSWNWGPVAVTNVTWALHWWRL